MKATLTKFSLTYAREGYLRAKEVQELFISDAYEEAPDGNFKMSIGKYRRLYRKYVTRQRQCARRYHRKSKSTRKLMTTTDNWR